MGLYLCIFDRDEEIDGVEVGAYSDFNRLREYIVSNVENDRAGSRFPNFILHSDSDGDWAVENCAELLREIENIIEELKERPTVPFVGWQVELARTLRLSPSSAYESFIDVDGEILLDRLRKLVLVALENKQPILFQ